MDFFTILFFGFLLFFSALFSASEIAIMSLPSHAVDALLKKKKIGALTLQKLKRNTDKLLITILIGSNLLNTLTASLATKIAIDLARSSRMEESLAIGISTGIITFFLLTFTDIIPKSL
jgi:Mg2+/Co2+ transporter CorB